MIAEESLSVQLACRLLEVTRSGYYAAASRPPSARSIRHAWLTNLIGQIHAASGSTYGAPRVHAELRMGRGITVGHNAVAMLMRRAGLRGLPERKRWRARPNTASVADLVDRNFAVIEPDVLWLTDVTEHPTREHPKQRTPRIIRFSPRGSEGRTNGVLPLPIRGQYASDHPFRSDSRSQERPR